LTHDPCEHDKVIAELTDKNSIMKLMERCIITSPRPRSAGLAERYTDQGADCFDIDDLPSANDTRSGRSLNDW
jgi:hypothetical protein